MKDNPQGQPVPNDQRRTTLQAAAEAKRRATVERLKGGIVRLQERSAEITAKAIERETGLTFRSIQRNIEAHELFRQHAEFFRTRSKLDRVTGAGQEHQGHRLEKEAMPQDEALMGYAKRKLVERQRQLERRVADLERELAQVASRQQEVLRRNLILQAELTAAKHQLLGALTDGWYPSHLTSARR